MKKRIYSLITITLVTIGALFIYPNLLTDNGAGQGPGSTIQSPTVSDGNSDSKVQTNESGWLKVHFIDVGQADSILIQTPGGKNMLIDAGNNDDGSKVVSYLKSFGAEKVDVVIGTHPHEDHIGGLDTVIKALDIGRIYMPKISNNTQSFQDVLASIKAKGLKVSTAAAGITVELDPAVTLSILAPASKEYDELNNYSAVVKLIYGSCSFLFTGDAENILEEEMLKQKTDLTADVLKVGHHGSGNSTSLEFLKAVMPDYAVISVGRNNDYAHPSEKTLKRLDANGIQVFRTDLSGTIVLQSDGKDISFNKER